MTTVHTNAVEGISSVERERRRKAVEVSIHSLEMEGLAVSDDDIVAGEEFIAGEMTLDEFIERGLARFVRA